MSKLVVVTYDLHKPYPPNSHSKVNKRFNVIGLKKHIETSRGKSANLPANTFAKKRHTNSSSSDVRDQTKKKLDKIFNRLNLNRTLFIFVGKGWSWKNSPRK